MPITDKAVPDQLIVPADLKFLGDVRAWVRQRAEPGAFSDRDLGDIALAVTEAVSNVIRHVYGEDSRHHLTVRASLKGERFVIKIVDTGPPFAGTAARSDLEPERAGGYGLALISKIMDDATWTTLPDGGTELRLMRLCPGVHA